MSTPAPISTSAPTRKKVTTLTYRQKKERGEPITMLTAYDYPTAMALDRAGIDSILVGDSLAMVVLGYENTLPVTMEEMLHHCRAVARGARSALLIGDMPFMSYQVSVEEATRNAGRFLQQGGMDAVKLEGGRERADAIRSITSAGIPVMGHIGLTPQSVNQLGGFRAQGKTALAAKRLVEDALILEEAGCFSIVLESVPARLAELISKKLSIRPLASARAQAVMDRSWSRMTCSVCSIALRRSSSRNMRTSITRCRRRSPITSKMWRRNISRRRNIPWRWMIKSGNCTVERY
jgi:3-methyl-2-oxobutanoate hydroxymethyltransferase